MNYDLAKNLKDAGFPQVVKDGTKKTLQNKLCEEHKVNLHKDVDMAEYIELIPKLGGCPKCDFVYYPTLSELIEACGDDFGSLIGNKDCWTAGTTSCMDCETYSGEKNLFKTGSTPDISVANLWLELHKNSVEQDEIRPRKIIRDVLALGNWNPKTGETIFEVIPRSEKLPIPEVNLKMNL